VDAEEVCDDPSCDDPSEASSGGSGRSRGSGSSESSRGSGSSESSPSSGSKADENGAVGAVQVDEASEADEISEGESGSDASDSDYEDDEDFEDDVHEEITGQQEDQSAASGISKLHEQAQLQQGRGASDRPSQTGADGKQKQAKRHSSSSDSSKSGSSSSSSSSSSSKRSKNSFKGVRSDMWKKPYADGDAAEISEDEDANMAAAEPQYERRTRREIHQPPDPYEAYQQELEAEIPEWEELRPVGQVVCAEHENKQKTRIGHHMHGDDEGQVDGHLTCATEKKSQKEMIHVTP